MPRTATAETSVSATPFAADCDVVHRKKSQSHAKPAWHDCRSPLDLESLEKAH